MVQVDTKTSKRLRRSNIASFLLWGLNMALILANGPFWMILAVGVIGSFFALRDWHTIRSLTRNSINPPHPDPDVQALIDGEIDISEYRQRKEKINAGQLVNSSH